MPFGEGYAMFKTNETLVSLCGKYGLSAEGLDSLSGPAWIVPGFAKEASLQHETSLKMRSLISILEENVHGAKDEINNAVFSVTIVTIEASPNMVKTLFKMAEICHSSSR